MSTKKKAKSFARKTSTVPSRVWVYGIEYISDENQKILLEQLRAGHDYRNKMVEILLAQKSAAKAIRETPAIAAAKATIATLQAAKEELCKTIKSLRAKVRSRKVDTSSLSAQVKDIARQIKEEWAKLKILYAERKDSPEIATSVKESRIPFHAAALEERAKTPAFWGTYLLAEQAAQKAKKFKRWTSEGRIGVQIQKGTSVPKLATHTYLQIDPVPAAAFDTNVGRAERARLSRTTVRMRVGTKAGGRAPIWFEAPMILHRELPKDAKVMGAYIQRKRIGTRWRHTLHIMMESMTFGGGGDGPCLGKGVVAIDIGWRKRADGANLRVAYFCDDSGRHGEIRLPIDPPRVPQHIETPSDAIDVSTSHLVRRRGWTTDAVRTLLGEPDSHLKPEGSHFRKPQRRYLMTRVLAVEATADFKRMIATKAQPFTGERTIASRLDRVDTLRSTRDKNFDNIRETLKIYLRDPGKSPTGGTNEVPIWLKEKTQYLSAWKAPRRLVVVAHEWAKQRFKGDENIFATVDAWRRQDRHLYQWESNERSSTLGRRKDFYRVISNSEFATRYATIVLEKFDLRNVAKRAKAEDAKEAHPTARHNRHASALSEFRLVLRSAVARQGGKVVLVPAAGTTMECHLCGHAEPWDAAPKIMHTCEGCGRTWDQDENAARNMLARFARGEVVKDDDSESEEGPFPDGDGPDSVAFTEVVADL
jgi:hypothetical protein